MIKEIKYLIFIIIIILFIFFTGKYYFSETNIKNSYKSLSTIDQKIKLYSEKLIVLENDTKNIIEYTKSSNENSVKRKFNFWNLLETDE